MAMNDKQTLKLCDTPLVRALRSAVDDTLTGAKARMLRAAFLARWEGEILIVLPEARALLQAAELWDSLPEANQLMLEQDSNGVWRCVDYHGASWYQNEALRTALALVAAALEAKRRNKEAEND